MTPEQRQARNAYQRKRRDQTNASRRERYATDPAYKQRVLERNRRWERQAYNAARRERRAQRRDEINASQRARYAERRDQINANRRERRAQRRDQINAYRRERYATNPAYRQRVRDKEREYRRRHREIICRRRRRRYDDLTPEQKQRQLAANRKRMASMTPEQRQAYNARLAARAYAKRWEDRRRLPNDAGRGMYWKPRRLSWEQPFRFGNVKLVKVERNPWEKRAIEAVREARPEHLRRAEEEYTDLCRAHKFRPTTGSTFRFLEDVKALGIEAAKGKLLARWEAKRKAT